MQGALESCERCLTGGQSTLLSVALWWVWHWYVECGRCAVGTSSYLVLAIKRRNSLKCKESIQSKSAEPHQLMEQSLSVPCPQPPNRTLENSHPQAKAAFNIASRLLKAHFLFGLSVSTELWTVGHLAVPQKNAQKWKRKLHKWEEIALAMSALIWAPQQRGCNREQKLSSGLGSAQLAKCTRLWV